jgi:patatin-like phospholipase/acyl hydrolase
MEGTSTIHPRDRHLFGAGPKRILALDGGGVRGVVSVAFLERIEDVLNARSGGHSRVRLCDYLGLIGGTSMGAIIATALTVGMRVAEIRGCRPASGSRVAFPSSQPHSIHRTPSVSEPGA